MRTLGQKEFIEGVHDWWENEFPRREYLSLQGYGGTGKTYIISELVKEFPDLDIIFVAQTGKATDNLQVKGLRANTICSEFYDVGEGSKLSFNLKKEWDLPQHDIVVIDESSMVTQEQASDLIGAGYRVIFVGDWHQLGVVSGTQSQYLKNPDFVLSEIVRQSADSGILKLANEFLERRRLPGYGRFSDDVLVIPKSKITEELILQCDQCICGTNATRDEWNKRVRRANGFTDYLPMKGERVISVKNMRDCMVDGRMIINGTTGKVNMVKHTLNGYFICQFQPYKAEHSIILKVDENFFMGKARKQDIELAQMDWGYVLTVNKSQGSEWDTVLFIIDGNIPKESLVNNVYTGITRAKKRLIIAYDK